MKFAAVNRCIYCFRDSVEVGHGLTDEHIIAEGLNGFFKLPKASCKNCAKITSQIEMAFMRGPAWPLRTALAFSSKRKNRPTHFKLLLTRNGSCQQVEIPLNEYPVILPMPVFAPMPPIVEVSKDALTGEALIKGLVMATLGGPTASELLQQIKDRYRADLVELPSLDVSSFARMIAKSAYALAVAHLGLEVLGSTQIANAIIDRTQDIFKYIGSGYQFPLEPEPAQHITQVQQYQRGEEKLVLVLMKLVANLATPGYAIAVV